MITALGDDGAVATDPLGCLFVKTAVRLAFVFGEEQLWSETLAPASGPPAPLLRARRWESPPASSRERQVIILQLQHWPPFPRGSQRFSWPTVLLVVVSFR
jgi:hypothetical protein